MPARRALLTLTAAAMLALGVVSPAAAVGDLEQQKRALDRQVAAVRAELRESSEAAVMAAVRLKEARMQLPSARSALSAAEAQVASAQLRDAQAARDLVHAQRAEKKAARELSATELRLAETERKLGELARAAYQQGGFGGIEVVLDSQTPKEFTDGIVAVGAVLDSESDLYDVLTVQRADAARQRAALASIRLDVAQLRDEAAAHLGEVTRLLATARAAEERVDTLITQRRRALRAAEAARVADERREAQLEAESTRVQDVLRELAQEARAREAAEAAEAAAQAEALAAAQATDAEQAAARAEAIAEAQARVEASAEQSAASVTVLGALGLPVTGPITSPYGMRVHPITGERKMHDGTDYGSACGTPIRAAATGTVVQATALSGYGNQVVLDHGIIRGAALATSYSHQSRMAVSAGQQVSRGQVIGYIGSTGFSTGCHLHFMVYNSGTPVDPAGWL